MFSTKLQNLLKKRAMSQSELAAILNTHRQNVHQWVKGITTPRNEMLKKIAKVFEVTLSHLIDEDSPENAASETEQTPLFPPKKSEPISLKSIFSSNLKFYRKQQDLTQAKFAKAIGTDPVYISYIENGMRFPSIDFIEKMAEILGIESYRLFLPREN